MNAVVVSGVALFFWWAFGFAKHDPVLRTIIPFGEDPYDAVSSFGVIAAILLAFVSLTRTFFPKIVGRSGQPIYVLRAEIAISTCVLVTIAAEAVAMARHPSLWIAAPGRNLLLLLLAMQLGLSFATFILFRKPELRDPSKFMKTLAVLLGMGILLAVYPERLILKTGSHLLTVIFGAALLFVSVSILVKVWVPDVPKSTPSRKAAIRKHLRIAPYGIAILMGACIGAIACMSELRESSQIAFTRILYIGSVYTGLGSAGLLIGYISLGKLLGFVIDEPELRSS